VPVALKFTGNKATLTWLSTSGAVYRVGYKNSLSDTTWTMASGVITATGNTSSWIDTEASNRHQRYYVVIRVL
jgi:hypothetical protein